MLLTILSLFAMVVVALTMFLSAHDLTLKGARWNVRRVAFVLAGSGAVWIMLLELFSHYRPLLPSVMFQLGVAVVFMTNPFQLPWHKWIWKGSHGGVV